VTSWASFLIPPEVVPGRMAMLITLFLVLINIFNSVTAISPNVEGMTAISAWMIVCILFVFAALAGYAYLVRTKEGREKEEEELSAKSLNSSVLSLKY
jgi:divalent metal cation (Fe/Co/Zn/Cd) transporter